MADAKGLDVLVIGERINARRKRINIAVKNRDDNYIAREAHDQAEAGADYIDCNGGSKPDREIDNLKWLIAVAQDAVDLPVSIDSANPEAIAEGLKLASKKTIINGMTAEAKSIAAVMPLAREYKAILVALCRSDSGVPSGVEDRMEAAMTIRRAAEAEGVPLSRIYFDPILAPLSTHPAEAMAAVETVQRIMTEFDGAHTTCGLSNISFGLPRRNVLNRTFLAMMMAAGLDGVIMDPTEPHMMSTVLAGQALAGRDEWCMDYIQAGRRDRLE